MQCFDIPHSLVEIRCHKRSPEMLPGSFHMQMRYQSVITVVPINVAAITATIAIYLVFILVTEREPSLSTLGKFRCSHKSDIFSIRAAYDMHRSVES